MLSDIVSSSCIHVGIAGVFRSNSIGDAGYAAIFMAKVGNIFVFDMFFHTFVR